MTPLLEHLVLYAGSKCNAHCSMCDVGQSAGTGIARPLSEVPDFMPLSLLEKVLDDPLVSNKKPRMNTYFVMTEPLLTPHLPKLLEAAKTRGHPVYLTTNGLLLEKRANEIAPFLDNIQISLDGPQEIHDKIRGKGFFSAALAGMAAIRALRPDLELVVNTTIFHSTAPHLLELAAILDSWGIRIDRLKFQGLDFVSEAMCRRHNAKIPEIPQSESTRGEAMNFDAMDFDQLASTLIELRRWKPRNIIKLGFKPPFTTADELRRYYSREGRVMDRWKRCITPWVSLAVNTAGHCFSHTRCFNGYILGDASAQPLSEIFFGERARFLRDRLSENDLCLPACTRCCGVNPLESWEIKA